MTRGYGRAKGAFCLTSNPLALRWRFQPGQRQQERDRVWQLHAAGVSSPRRQSLHLYLRRWTPHVVDDGSTPMTDHNREEPETHASDV